MPLKLYRPKGSQNWHYTGTVDGRRLRGSTRTADKKIAQRLTAEKETRAWKRHLDGPESVTTFANCVAFYAASGKPTERFVEKLLDYWKDTPVKEITAQAVRASCRILYPNRSNATWNRQAIVPTVAIINHASEMELCQPIKVKRFKVVSKVKEAADYLWIKSFTASAAAAGNSPLGALALLMFLTGARITEALSIDWSVIDLHGRAIRIRSTKTGGDERVANMPPELVVAFANLPEPHEGKVFPWKHRQNLKTQWAGAIRRAGIKSLTPHCLRHGFFTSLLQSGVDVKTAADLGGLKTANILLNVYAHAARDPRITDVLTKTGKFSASNEMHGENNKQKKDLA